jgi:uncharacterized protein
LTVVYVDSSALLKRVLIEPQSDALTQALNTHHGEGDLLVSSSLAWVEIWRGLRRLGIQDLADSVASATAGIAEYPVSAQTFLLARSIGTDLLRTLDALHLAAAVSVGAEQVMTYDERLSEAARGVGLAILTPA